MSTATFHGRIRPDGRAQLNIAKTCPPSMPMPPTEVTIRGALERRSDGVREVHVAIEGVLTRDDARVMMVTEGVEGDDLVPFDRVLGPLTLDHPADVPQTQRTG